MKCLTKEELIDIVFRGEEGVLQKETAEHFGICADCSHKLAVLKSSARTAATVSPTPVSGDFTAKLMERLDKRAEISYPAQTSNLFNWFTPKKLVFAAAALMITIGFILKTERVITANPSAILYFTDAQATPIRVATLIDTEQSKPVFGKTAMYYSDSCLMARCGL